MKITRKKASNMKKNQSPVNVRLRLIAILKKRNRVKWTHIENPPKLPPLKPLPILKSKSIKVTKWVSTNSFNDDRVSNDRNGQAREAMAVGKCGAVVRLNVNNAFDAAHRGWNKSNLSKLGIPGCLTRLIESNRSKGLIW